MAVKTLASRDPDKVAKFMDEAELMKNFSHPNIVSLLGILHWMTISYESFCLLRSSVVLLYPSLFLIHG